MKINQIIVESDQLDELGLGDVGRGIGTVAGKTAGALGGFAGGVAGLGTALKKGYQAGKSHVGGQEVGRSYVPQTRMATQPAQGVTPDNTDAEPSQPPRSPQTFADMDDQELENLKTFIDRELGLRRSGNPAGGRGAGGPPSGNNNTSTPAGGNTPAASTGGSPAPQPSGGTKQPTANQIIQGPDGLPYQWLGSQWAVYNPATGRAGKVARRDMGAQLTQAVSSGSAQPYTPAAGVSPAPAPVGSRPPAAGETQSPYGNLTASQRAFVAAREKEGLDQDQIKTALARGGGGGGKRAPLTRTARLNTIGNNPAVTTDMPMSQADPESFAAGQQRRAELDAQSRAAVTAKRPAKQPAAPATNEGFYSRFLGQNI